MKGKIKRENQVSSNEVEGDSNAAGEVSNLASLECGQRTALVTCFVICFSLFSFPALPAESPIHFTEVTDSAGIDFTHANGATGEFHLPETLGTGGAFLDYNNDGNLDLYLVNSVAPSALFRNNGDGTFTDVTASAKVNNQGSYGHGVACGDVDNDGYVDLYVTNFGSEPTVS